MSAIHSIHAKFVARVGVTEAAIISTIVRRALGFGWLVTVNDGEEDAVVKSDVEDEIFEEIGHTDQTVLIFTHPGGDLLGEKIEPSRLGFVWLVHGNEEDVIADHTDCEPMAELTAGVY